MQYDDWDPYMWGAAFEQKYEGTAYERTLQFEA